MVSQAALLSDRAHSFERGVLFGGLGWLCRASEGFSLLQGRRIDVKHLHLGVVLTLLHVQTLFLHVLEEVLYELFSLIC